MAAEERVKISIEAGVADVRMNRPDKLNALDQALFDAINGAIAALKERRDVRCVVFSGEGRAFSAGIDTSRLGGPEARARSGLRDLTTRTHGLTNSSQAAAWGWRELPMPVIAAVHGYAFGAGFQIMLGADIRIAAPDATLSIMEARWGLVPDVAGVALLRTLVRDDVARELTYTARRFSGQEGARLGVITRVAADPRGEALALARTIAGQSPYAMRAAKRLFNFARDARPEEILLAESREAQALLNGANHAEAVAAGRADRPPVFED